MPFVSAMPALGAATPKQAQQMVPSGPKKPLAPRSAAEIHASPPPIFLSMARGAKSKKNRGGRAHSKKANRRLNTQDVSIRRWRGAQPWRAACPNACWMGTAACRRRRRRHRLADLRWEAALPASGH